MKTKGIILAGGSGTRLFPITKVYSKQLVLIYDKPMIYYPLSTLMLSGIREILIIADYKSIKMYKQLLGTGQLLGISIKYAVQKQPRGIAEAFIIGESFIKKDNIALILGDNIFYGSYQLFRNSIKNNRYATIFGYYVSDAKRYGVIEFDEKTGKIKRLVEKPKKHISNYAIPGFYIYNYECINIAKSLKPSNRGELEITELNRVYLKRKQLNAIKIGRGFAWLDTGTPSSIMDASNFIEAIEKRQGLKIGCIEEIALRTGYINKTQYKKLIANYPPSPYKDYLGTVVA